MSETHSIGYTYEADHHCGACTVIRFGSTEGVDDEGNDVGAVLSWDEWYNVGAECQTLACGDCGSILDEYRPLDLIEQDATSEGESAGKAAASWYFDGNTSRTAYERTLAGIEDGDPMIMDSFPGSPFSGEYADGLSAQAFLGGYRMTADDPAADDILRTFEDAYGLAAQDEIERVARYQVAP